MFSTFGIGISSVFFCETIGLRFLCSAVVFCFAPSPDFTFVKSLLWIASVSACTRITTSERSTGLTLFCLKFYLTSWFAILPNLLLIICSLLSLSVYPSRSFLANLWHILHHNLMGIINQRIQRYRTDQTFMNDGFEILRVV